jgi:hypothetical protein
MADVSDRDIQATTRLVIKRHGGSAGYFAASRAAQLPAATSLSCPGNKNLAVMVGLRM